MVLSQLVSGFNAIRVSKSGAPLPSARRVSIETISQRDVLSKRVNTLLMELGQFIDHDLTQAPIHIQGTDLTYF